jgi:DNA polymerase I-like protein with 3'-5' exonuclease and polymerase domains
LNESGLGQVEQLIVGRFRGGCRYTEFSNSLFQGLAADLAKHALWLVTKACYVQPQSPLFGSRPVNFVHDELVTEIPDNDRAHDAVMEQERIMIKAARGFLPDISNIECETVLARCWSKAAKPVRDAQGRLIPWDLKKS